MPTPEHSNQGMTREQADACIVLLPGCTICTIPGHGYSVRDDRNGVIYSSRDGIVRQVARSRESDDITWPVVVCMLVLGLVLAIGIPWSLR